MRRIPATSRRLPAVLAAALLALTGLAAAGCLPAQPGPTVMAALGDSITRGFDSCGLLADCPQVSWATGTDSGLRSQRARLAGGARLGGRPGTARLTAYNDAMTGATSANLLFQARRAVQQHADYVTVLIGANDVCTGDERVMTPSTVFGGRVRAALTYLHSARPGVRIFVASLPDLRRLWQVASVVPRARLVWQVAGVCPVMLANPRSFGAADTARRARVAQRVADDNAALHQACAAVAGCSDDGGAVYRYPFTVADLSGWDFFHPNRNGQRILAEITSRRAFAA